MALNLRSEDGSIGSVQRNSSDDDVAPLFSLRKEQLELLVIRTLQEVAKPFLESLIRKVVNEEIKSILNTMKRNSGNEIHSSESRNLQLKFLDNLCLSVLTGMPIEGIRVALFDGLTGQIVESGPEASAKVEIVVLKEDFDNDVETDWTTEDFNQKIVRETEGKKSILTGNVYLNLKQGTGCIGQVSFTHNSSWMKSGGYRLGARVVDNFSGVRVREAKTDSFVVKDRRSTLYEKHYPPFASDDVWRLKHIQKDGKFHRRLHGEKINSVKDFLTLLSINHKRLQQILGVGDKDWKKIVSHAQTCKPDGTMYLYHAPSSEQKTGVIFNVLGQLIGQILEGHYVPSDGISASDKFDAGKLLVSASEHWGDVVSFDDINSLMHHLSVLHPSKSPGQEILNDNDSGRSNVVCGYDFVLPSISSPGIIPEHFSFDDGSSFIPHLSSPHPSKLQNPCGHISETFDMVNRYDHTMPSISSPGITSGDAVSFDGEIPSTPILYALHPSNSAGMENHSCHDSVASDMVNGYNHIVPTIFSQRILSSNFSVEGPSIMDPCGLLINDDVEFIKEPFLGDQGEFPHPPSCNIESKIEDDLEVSSFFNNDPDLEAGNYSVELHNAQQSGDGSSLLVSGQAITMNNKAPMRWTKVYSLLLWFSVKKTTTRASSHVRKKLKFS